MTPPLVRTLLEELSARQLDANGMAPSGTMFLSLDYLAAVSVAQLFDLLVRRREKIVRSVERTSGARSGA